MFQSFDDIAKYYNTEERPQTKGDLIELVLAKFLNDNELVLMVNISSSFSKNILLVIKTLGKVQNIVDTGVAYNEIDKLTPELLNSSAIRLAKKHKINDMLDILIKLKSLRKFIKIQNLKNKLK